MKKRWFTGAGPSSIWIGPLDEETPEMHRYLATPLKITTCEEKERHEQHR